MKIFLLESIKCCYAVAFALNFVVIAANADPVPDPPMVPATSYILIDHDSGMVLAEKNAHLRLEPASLTKIMTVFVAANEVSEGNIRLDQKILVSEKAWRMKGSRMFIEVGKEVSVEELLHGVIVQSGNDASVALAEAVSGTEDVFTALMNSSADRLGLSETRFQNSSGWPADEHYTTARDLATLTRALIQMYPDIYGWFALREYTFNGITQPNRNRLLFIDPAVDGVKTGHTEAAGYCLVASATQDDMRLISVVMGAESDAERVEGSRSLLNYGFRFYETHRLYGEKEPITDVKVWKGSVDSVALGLSHPLYVTIPRRRYEDLKATINIDQHLIAPLTAGDSRGTVSIALDSEELVSRPLILLDNVPETGTFGRLVDTVRLWFE
jgi:D-alanyl-D-alanine carboxypeptidase (penicillin-binding protein 5/6)